MQINRMKYDYYKISNYIFFIFIVILIIEAFIYFFGYRLNNSFPNFIFEYGNPNEGWNPFIWEENRLIENIQLIFLIIAIITLNLIFFKNYKFLILKDNFFLRTFLILKIIFLLYYFLEEISWGQHFINFKTPMLFLDENNFIFNHQGEFNLHNTSNLFNEIPRTFVFFWCGFSIILVDFFKSNLNTYVKNIINPSSSLIIISFIIIFITVPDKIFSKFDLLKYSELHLINSMGKQVYDFFNIMPVILSLNFLKLSELQELFFTYYFFWHSYFLKVNTYKFIIKK